MTLAIAFALAAAARCRSTQCQQEKRRGETLQYQQHNQCAQPEKDLSTRHETMHARDSASRRQTAFPRTKLGTIDKCSTGQNVQNEVGDATKREELLDQKKNQKKKRNPHAISFARNGLFMRLSGNGHPDGPFPDGLTTCSWPLRPSHWAHHARDADS